MPRRIRILLIVTLFLLYYIETKELVAFETTAMKAVNESHNTPSEVNFLQIGFLGLRLPSYCWLTWTCSSWIQIEI
jgi:hypothetical protein